MINKPITSEDAINALKNIIECRNISDYLDNPFMESYNKEKNPNYITNLEKLKAIANWIED